MNIVLLHYSAPPIVGGVESVMGYQARQMAAAGHRVTLVAGRGAQLDNSVGFKQLPLLDSRHPRVLAAKAQLDVGRLPGEFAALSADIERDLQPALAGVDVVLAHNVCSLHKNLALTAALRRLLGQPSLPRLILWHHDLAWTTERYRAELHDGYPWDLLRQVWPGARQVVVSQARQRELAGLLGLPADAIGVVPNGVDVGRLLKLSEPTRALAAGWRLEEAAPLLLLPVRLTPRKNIELALRVLAALRRQPSVAGQLFGAARLLITGPAGPHNPANADYLRQLIALCDDLGLAGAAHFAVEQAPGGLSDEVVGDLYRLADALLLPSREEGFGIPLLEAGLARLPIFCTDIEPLQALGAAEVTYFSPEAAPEAVADAVAQRLGRDAVYRMAVRTRQNYAWERVYTEHIAPLLQGGTP